MNWDQFAAFFFMLGIFGIGVAALTLVLDVMFPQFILRARTAAEQMPVRSALVGFINFAFFSILAIAVLSIGQVAENRGSSGGAGFLRFIGALIILFLVAFIAFGLAVMARWVGERIAPNASARRQSVSGIVALELASLAPLVGWIFVPLAVTFVGYGAVIIALVWRRTPPQPQSPVSSP